MVIIYLKENEKVYLFVVAAAKQSCKITKPEMSTMKRFWIQQKMSIDLNDIKAYI